MSAAATDFELMSCHIIILISIPSRTISIMQEMATPKGTGTLTFLTPFNSIPFPCAFAFRKLLINIFFL